MTEPLHCTCRLPLRALRLTHGGRFHHTSECGRCGRFLHVDAAVDPTPPRGLARPRRRSREWLRLVAVPIMALGIWVFPSIAEAHHTTITCTDRATSTWTIVNSESNTSMTFSTSSGASGSIAAGGSTTVVYSGTSLTVSGRWANGQTNTSTGTGNCVPASTTTTTSSTTSTTSTTVPPSTSSPSTSTIPAPSTSMVPSCYPVPLPTDGTNHGGMVCGSVPSTFPPESPPAIPPTVNVPPAVTVPAVAVGDPPAAVPSGQLPETGGSVEQAIGLSLIALGFVLAGRTLSRIGRAR